MQLKRILIDVIIVLIILLIYITKVYELFPNPLQLLSLKVILVSAGFMHAHITRKIAFGKVDWDKEGINAKSLLVIVLYAVFIYAYSQGG
ncbi:MAG: hypothetical protein ACP5PT_00830 [Brevinematia bacterium]